MNKLSYVIVVCCLAGILSDQAAILCSGSHASRWRLSALLRGQERAKGDDSDDGASSSPPGAPVGEGFAYASGSEYRRWSKSGEFPSRGAEGGAHTGVLRGAVGPGKSEQVRPRSVYAGAAGCTRDSSAGQGQQRGTSRSCADLRRASVYHEREGNGGTENLPSDAAVKPLGGRSHGSLRDTQGEPEPCMRRTKSDSATKTSSSRRTSPGILKAMQILRRRSDSDDVGGLQNRMFNWLANWHTLNPTDLRRTEASSSLGTYVMVLHSTGQTHTQLRTPAEFEEKEKLDKIMKHSLPRAVSRARRLALKDWAQRREVLVGVWPSGTESDQESGL